MGPRSCLARKVPLVARSGQMKPPAFVGTVDRCGNSCWFRAPPPRVVSWSICDQPRRRSALPTVTPRDRHAGAVFLVVVRHQRLSRHAGPCLSSRPTARPSTPPMDPPRKARPLDRPPRLEARAAGAPVEERIWSLSIWREGAALPPLAPGLPAEENISPGDLLGRAHSSELVVRAAAVPARAHRGRRRCSIARPRRSRRLEARWLSAPAARSSSIAASSAEIAPVTSAAAWRRASATIR